MNADDYKDALDMTDRLSSNREVTTIHGRVDDIEAQVSGALWSFMQSVFSRVDEEYEFKQEIRDELRARMSEMDVGMLMALYNRLNDHEVEGVRTALYPFIPKEGGRNGEASGGAGFLDSLKAANDAPEKVLHDGADAEVLRGIQHLNILLGQVDQDSSGSGNE
ncbi:MAG: hypothetical protein LC687_04120 [Actinobacteria bacterium]|nr:hypothetical protein [Actinomycetota bacterium]MCA1807021.1 hypothetical protein [Actinomycetota bacterium]